LSSQSDSGAQLLSDFSGGMGNGLSDGAPFRRIFTLSFRTGFKNQAGRRNGDENGFQKDLSDGVMFGLAQSDGFDARLHHCLRLLSLTDRQQLRSG